MLSDMPTPPLCPDCREPMKFVKTIPQIGGLPELFVFYCSRCRQAETKLQEMAGNNKSRQHGHHADNRMENAVRHECGNTGSLA